MKSFAHASLLLAAFAGIAHADDPDDAALRATLRRGDPGEAHWSKLYARATASLAGSRDGAVLVVWREQRPFMIDVVDHHAGAYRVWLYSGGAVLALWISPADIIPVVTREAGVAEHATSRLPSARGDGLFL